MRSRFRYFVLVLLLAWSVGYQVPQTLKRIAQIRHPEQFPTTPLFMRGSPVKVSRLAPEALKAGLKDNDEVLAVNGQAPRGARLVRETIGRMRPGDTLRIRARRDGKEFEAAIVLKAEAGDDLGSVGSLLLGILLGLTMPWLCIATGFWVAFRRPFDPQAWLLLWLMLATYHLIGFSTFVDWGPLSVWATVWSVFLNSSWPLSMMLFGIYFPERWIVDRWKPWIKWVVVTLALALLSTNLAASLAFEYDYELATRIVTPIEKGRTFLMVFVMAQIGVFFAALGHKRSYAKGDVKRRLNLLFAGAVAAMTPLLMLVLYGLVKRGGALSNVNPWILVPVLLMVFLFPLTIAYVIVVEQAMDVRMVVRQSLQYAFARSSVRVIEALLFVFVAYYGSTMLDDKRNRPQKIMIVGGAVFLLVLAAKGSRRLSVWIDRRFFRDAYNAEQVLSALIQDVRTMVETRPLLETVAQRIAGALHVERLAFLLEGGGKLVPVHAVGYDVPPAVEFTPNSATAKHLMKAREPLAVHPEKRENWVRHDDVDDAERGRLSVLDAQLLLPLTVKDRLLGFISLGPKRSEEPYSPNDVSLLRSVAVQTGLALENSRLTEAVASEVAQRERMNRELEIAREVQERFFPQNLPVVAGLDYAGACRPARGVGGDYYDFLVLPHGHLGIAVADVSGKGIPAALLMASLQASLRGQAINGTSDLAGLMTNVNKLVYDASPSNRYATFFYAQYDPASRELIYVNGGHNSPLLLRGDRVIALETGGPLVGLFPSASYEQGAVTLEPGDTLLLFTDGVSEAMNAADEEFGEDRLIETARVCGHLTSREMLPRVFSACDAFAAGAPQHDDMTLVVVKVG